MQRAAKYLLILGVIVALSSCASKKPGVTKEKQTQIDNDKKNFEDNVK